MYIAAVSPYFQISFNSTVGYGWPRIGLVHSESGEKEDFDKKDSFDKGTRFVLEFGDREGWQSKIKTDFVWFSVGSSSWPVRFLEAGVKWLSVSIHVMNSCPGECMRFRGQIKKMRKSFSTKYRKIRYDITFGAGTCCVKKNVHFSILHTSKSIYTCIYQVYIVCTGVA